MAERIMTKIRFEVAVARENMAVASKTPDPILVESVDRLDQVVKSWEDVNDIATLIEQSMDETWLTRKDRNISEGEEGLDELGADAEGTRADGEGQVDGSAPRSVEDPVKDERQEEEGGKVHKLVGRGEGG